MFPIFGSFKSDTHNIQHLPLQSKGETGCTGLCWPLWPRRMLSAAVSPLPGATFVSRIIVSS